MIILVREDDAERARQVIAESQGGGTAGDDDETQG
jgi:hypothetical protein